MGAADRRLELHDILCGALGSGNVYFQPPESVKMQYPAIVYGLEDIRPTYANGGAYLSRRGYSVTVIDTDPDSAVVGRVAALPMCRFGRHFRSDNLNHYVFTIFY